MEINDASVCSAGMKVTQEFVHTYRLYDIFPFRPCLKYLVIT